ncbi:4'-phosphopantetheinyl transferase family protein [Salinimicrobium sp. TH3]|uniref:4'-phosphopantetheinyl transferase family protein n=1 Tax=Salinimicrobium sp. TH3 TaxID=2997342 RepID=UPI0022731285|nr:4'-phosphopantetheinyl transferase superfamily protein [Salinimicrobium sp. TH3]MCY2687044.1 4'-phosphopantetheinyl transferase superfamily protein [Salinimicrobium sp. TH3]
MIGNDVVDLKLAGSQSNWRRKGFLRKVFSPAEQEFISTSINQDKLVWLLWSMKEAAYKAHQREFRLPRRLNWLRQECSILEMTSGNAWGTIEIEGYLYSSSSEITSEFIHTSAEKNPSSGFKNVILESSSSAVKELLITKVAEHFDVDPHELQLKKDTHSMPFLSRKGCIFFNRFSFSGHGRFNAYSLSLINCETTVKQS